MPMHAWGSLHLFFLGSWELFANGFTLVLLSQHIPTCAVFFTGRGKKQIDWYPVGSSFLLVTQEFGGTGIFFWVGHNTDLEELCNYCWPSKLIVLAHVSWIQLFKSEFSCKREPAREECIWDHTQMKHLRSGWCREKTKVGKVTKNLARNFIRWAYMNIIGTSRFVCPNCLATQEIHHPSFHDDFCNLIHHHWRFLVHIQLHMSWSAFGFTSYNNTEAYMQVCRQYKEYGALGVWIWLSCVESRLWVWWENNRLCQGLSTCLLPR